MKLQDTILKRLTSKSPVSRFTLRSYLNAQGFVISDREMRRTIARLRDKGGHIIISSLRGYKLATTRKEFEGYVKFMKSYRNSLSRQIRLIERNFKRDMKYNLF